MTNKSDDSFVVVSDFSAAGPTRGSLNPVLGMCGEVLQPRREDDPAPEPTFSLPPNMKPGLRTAPPKPPAPKPKRTAAPKPPAPKRLPKERWPVTIARKLRREQREQRHKMRRDLWYSYGRESDPRLAKHEYLVGVYQSKPGELVVTPCEHWHWQVDTAIWCKTFPADRPPTHVVVASIKTGRVVRSLTKLG